MYFWGSKRVIGYIYTCDNCGSEEIETKSWTKYNKKTKTWDYVDTTGFDYSDNWCSKCEDHVEISSIPIGKIKLNKYKP